VRVKPKSKNYQKVIYEHAEELRQAAKKFGCFLLSIETETVPAEEH
jgi:hypothetical protein